MDTKDKLNSLAYGAYADTQPRTSPASGATFFPRYPGDIDPASLVDFGDGKTSTPATDPVLAERQAKSAPRPAPAPFVPTKPIKKAAALFRKRLNLRAYGYDDPVRGFQQIPKYKLEKHNRAAYEGFVHDLNPAAPGENPFDYLPELTSAYIQRALAGAVKLCCRSAWRPDADGVVRVLVRIDLDNKNGETDLPAMAAWADQLFGTGRVFFDSSGKSGFFWLTLIPTLSDDGTRTYYDLSRKWVNALLVRLHGAIGRAAIAAGFFSTRKINDIEFIQQRVEIQGGFETGRQVYTDGLPDGPRSIGNLDGRFACRLPRLGADATMADVTKLMHGCDITPGEIEKIIQACPPAPVVENIQEDEEDEGDDAEVPTTPRKQRKPKRNPKDMEKQPAKSSAVAAVVHQLKLKSRADILSRADEIGRLGSKLYAERGCGDDNYDPARAKDMAAAVQYVARTFNPAKIARKPKDNAWFDDGETDSDRSLFRSQVRLRGENERQGGKDMDTVKAALRKMGKTELDFQILAICDRAIAKNLHLNKRGRYEVPRDSALNMCNSKRFGLTRKVEPSTIAAAFRLLEKWHVIRTTAKAYEGHSCTFQYMRTAWYGYEPEGGCAKYYAVAVRTRERVS